MFRASGKAARDLEMKSFTEYTATDAPIVVNEPKLELSEKFGAHTVNARMTDWEEQVRNTSPQGIQAIL